MCRSEWWPASQKLKHISTTPPRPPCHPRCPLGSSLMNHILHFLFLPVLSPEFVDKQLPWVLQTTDAKSNYQLGELVKVENYPEVIRLIANYGDQPAGLSWIACLFLPKHWNLFSYLLVLFNLVALQRVWLGEHEGIVRITLRFKGWEDSFIVPLKQTGRMKGDSTPTLFLSHM